MTQQKRGHPRLIILALVLILSIGALAVPLLFMVMVEQRPSGEIAPTEAPPLPGPITENPDPARFSLLILIGASILFALVVVPIIGLRYLRQNEASAQQPEIKIGRSRIFALSIMLTLLALAIALAIIFFALTS